MEDIYDAGKLKGKKKEYYAMLMELREELLDEMQVHSDGGLKAEREAGNDAADLSSQNFMREFDLSMMGEEGKRLQKVEGAVKRLFNGKYGKCSDCGDKIPDGRLKAIPFARLCVGCKSVREEKEAKGITVEDNPDFTE
ncbi:hypothetical protein BVX99_02995 [bacterium F16]|nr:hypothetical protein BVX99_02995 [bacterium F16]